MWILVVALAWLAFPAQAGESALRPSARLLAENPDWLKLGRCVRYEEGGAGLVIAEPLYYLKGEVLSAEIRLRHLAPCPPVQDKGIERYSRAEFVRHALAYPCVSPKAAERDEQLGIVRLRVTDWETPYARKAENSGRLYRGHFLDQPLDKATEIELEADLLVACDR